MRQVRIVADKEIPFLSPYLCRNTTYLPGDEIINKNIREADALLVRSTTQCNEKLLHNTNVKIIISATIGDDHIDKNYCKAHNIEWRTAKGCNKMAVVQYVVMSLFYLDHKYDFDWMNKTIGIIGLGSIGGLLYDVLKKLGIRTMQNDPPRAMQEGSADFVDLQTIRDKADIISLHVPLIQEGNFSTRHLLNDDFFASGSKKITIINTSRGKVLSAETLKKWKARGVIDKLVLDVWENEPNVDPELLKMTNISTPHIAGYSLQGKKNASYQSLHHIEDFFKLSLPNIKKIIQPPPSQNIKYTCQNEAEKDAIWNILKQIWNIEQDSNSLSANPYLFKQLRKKYIFRPQISEFGIEFADCSPKIISTINTVSSANTGI